MALRVSGAGGWRVCVVLCCSLFWHNAMRPYRVSSRGILRGGTVCWMRAFAMLLRLGTGCHVCLRRGTLPFQMALGCRFRRALVLR